jgi:hypothetical protein
MLCALLHLNVQFLFINKRGSAFIAIKDNLDFNTTGLINYLVMQIILLLKFDI